MIDWGLETNTSHSRASSRPLGEGFATRGPSLYLDNQVTKTSWGHTTKRVGAICQVLS